MNETGIKAKRIIDMAINLGWTEPDPDYHHSILKVCLKAMNDNEVFNTLKELNTTKNEFDRRGVKPETTAKTLAKELIDQTLDPNSKLYDSEYNTEPTSEQETNAEATSEQPSDSPTHELTGNGSGVEYTLTPRTLRSFAE